MATPLTPSELATIALQEMRAGARRFVTAMVTERLSGPRPGRLGRRTGMGARSVDAVAAPAGSSAVRLTGFVRAAAAYLAGHEKGVTIAARRAKNLAIPVGRSLTRALVARFAGPKTSPIPLKFFRNPRTGKKLLVVHAQFSGKKKLDVRYVLQPTVTLPPRLGFEATFRREAARTLAAIKFRLSGKIVQWPKPGGFGARP